MGLPQPPVMGSCEVELRRVGLEDLRELGTVPSQESETEVQS